MKNWNGILYTKCEKLVVNFKFKIKWHLVYKIQDLNFITKDRLHYAGNRRIQNGHGEYHHATLAEN